MSLCATDSTCDCVRHLKLSVPSMPGGCARGRTVRGHARDWEVASQAKSRCKPAEKTILKLADLEQLRYTLLNSLTSSSKRSDDHPTRHSSTVTASEGH